MTVMRQVLIDKVWHGNDPFANFPRDLVIPDKQGWGANHPYLREAVKKGPKIVVEIGVWKGMSVLSMARAMKEFKVEGAIVAVDTWLGAWDHWMSEEWFAHLHFVYGYPSMHQTFMANVIDEGLSDYIVPLPLDSLNASMVFKKLKLEADVIHIDAGHDYDAVKADIKAWWPTLSSEGTLIGDDYRVDGVWPGVRQAFDEFVSETRLSLEHSPAKCRIIKAPPKT